MAPLISVCLPTYNGERFVADQIQSVLDQSFADFELVVSDDGSSDRTPDIVADFAARDPRIRILPASTRLGMQKNFERVICAGIGDYIAPCDQDDVWLPEKLAALRDHLHATQAMLVYSDSLLIDGDGRDLGERFLQKMFVIEGRDPMLFAFYNSVSGHAMLFDRKLLQDARPFPDVPFYDWWLGAVAAATGGIAVLRVPLMHHRRHGASVTGELRQQEAARKRRDYVDLNARETERLRSFARLPGKFGDDYARLAALWPRRLTDYLIPELAASLLRHQSVFAPWQLPKHRLVWRCLRRGLGMPLTSPLKIRRRRDDG